MAGGPCCAVGGKWCGRVGPGWPDLQAQAPSTPGGWCGSRPPFRAQAKADGLTGALRRPEKAFSLVLLPAAAASAPRPASGREATRASWRTSAGSLGAGDHGRPRPACLRHTQADVAPISSQQRNPRRSRAAKHVTNSSAAFGALVASETSKSMRLAQWRSAATKPWRRKAAI